MRAVSQVPVKRLRDHVVGHGVSAVSLDDVTAMTGLSRSAATEALRRARASGSSSRLHRGPTSRSRRSSQRGASCRDGLHRSADEAPGTVLLRRPAFGRQNSWRCAPATAGVFQIVPDKAVSDRDIERVRLRFDERSDLEAAAVQLVNSHTSQARVSTPEATAFDLVSRPQDSGALLNVATSIGELVQDEKLDAKQTRRTGAAVPARCRAAPWQAARSGCGVR